MKKNISLIGNCQTTALCKFIRELPEKHNAKWLCFEQEWANIDWPKSYKLFNDQTQHNIFDRKDCINFLKISDVIIVQPNKPYCDTISLHKKNDAQIISMSPIFVDNLKYITEKEQKYSTNIVISDIIRKYPKETLYIKNDNHPTTFLTLEILKEITIIANLKFFDEDSYQKLLKTQYPNYQ